MNKSVSKKVIEGKIQLVYITPENVIENLKYRTMFQSPVYKKHLVALVVDEAHCVKSWGEQFRKSFSQLGQLRSLLPTGVRVMALTATSTMETYNIVVQILSLESPVLVSVAPERSNIRLVHPKADLEEFCDILCKDFYEDTEIPKTVVFVRKYADCSSLYILDTTTYTR